MELVEKSTLIQALSKKMDYVSTIYDICRLQEEHIKADEVDKLEKALKRRQRLVDKIGLLDKENGGLNVKTLSENEDENVRKLAAGILQLLKDIAVFDKKNIEDAEAKILEYKTGIRNTKTDLKRISSYKKIQLNNDGVYFDRKK